MSRLGRLIDRWGLSVSILFLGIKFLQCLRRRGPASQREDGWRKITRIFLRTEESKFTLACFNLDFCSGCKDNTFAQKREKVIKGLGDFLKQQPVTHWQLRWGRFSAQRIRKDTVDMVHADFAEDGRLEAIIPYLDATLPSELDETVKNTLLQEFISAYNATRGMGDKTRPRVFKRHLEERLRSQRGAFSQETIKRTMAYLERVLSAVFIHFEGRPASDYCRFAAPAFITRKHPGFGIFNISCRFNSQDTVDLWIQCHHVCIDGMPMQEVLENLKARWGKSRVQFPPSCGREEVKPELYSTQTGHGGVYSIHKIVSFRPFLCLTREFNRERYASQLKKCITAFRLFIWKLGTHPVFRDKKFLVPVDVPARATLERTLGFILIRPRMYLDRYGPREGFLKFRQEFNRQTKEALARRSESYELFESFTLIPPLLCSLILKLMPVAVRELVGSVGVSIINKADVFIAPFSDVHTDGFIAISNFFTPTEDGDIGCYVSIKGPRDTIERYLAAIEEIAMAQTVEREASSERRKVAPGIPNFLEGRNLSEIAP